MNETAYELNTADPRLATGYQIFALSEPEVIPPEASGWLGGAGGIYSTPGDLAKWDLALISGKVLKPESYTLMTTARTLADGKSAGYGFGLSIKTQADRQVISHNGAVSGFNTYNAVVPSTRSAVIMTCNLEGGMSSLPAQLFALLLKEPSNIPAIAGAGAAEVVKSVFAELQRGKVNRRRFSEEFNSYLTDEKIAGASRRLTRYGEPGRVAVMSPHERGGMEVTTTRLSFSAGELRVLMYRRPDGIIEQFFVSRE
jgi:CubicO group peptidase (beta-lactamase class C family)